MNSLEQMLEDYRNDERGLPTYEELMKISSHVRLVEAQLIALSIDNRRLQVNVGGMTVVGEIVAVDTPGVMDCFPILDVKWTRNTPWLGTKLYVIPSEPYYTKEPSC
mgnify:CR=1 FL=1